MRAVAGQVVVADRRIHRGDALGHLRQLERELDALRSELASLRAKST